MALILPTTARAMTCPGRNSSCVDAAAEGPCARVSEAAALWTPDDLWHFTGGAGFRGLVAFRLSFSAGGPKPASESSESSHSSAHDLLCFNAIAKDSKPVAPANTERLKGGSQHGQGPA